MAVNIPTVRAASLPSLSRAQMEEVDRLMIEEYGIQLLQMMENAGLLLAELVRARLGPRAEDGRIVVLCGRGNNGGGGLVAARRLAAWGLDTAVVLTDAPAAYAGVPAQQLSILLKLGVPCGAPGGALPPHDLLVDAVIGYGLRDAPRGAARDLIAAANTSHASVVSLDAPSGLDVDSGLAPGAAVRAAATLTLALPKTGLLRPEGRAFTGELYLGDISVPPHVYERLGFPDVQPFAGGPLVRVLEDGAPDDPS